MMAQSEAGQSFEEERAVARAAAVEAELELLQVERQMLVANRALVGAEQPAAQQADPA